MIGNAAHKSFSRGNCLSMQEEAFTMATEYYKKIEGKWRTEYPSPKSLDEIWGFYRECGYGNPQQTLRGILDQVNWSKKRILDFGCDTGLMLDFICSQYPTITGSGIDINTAAIHTAQQTFPKFDLMAFDGFHIPYEDKTFDLVFVCAVIKHIRYEDREHIYNELECVADKVFFIEADSQAEEEVSYGSWTFYNSNFEAEFGNYFHPIELVREAGDILGLYRCE
jgi:SAM-dependent methyltransferase